ncbi:MAG: GH116 family glycosyl hydrolase [Candidatus Aminicenantes bacterium]|nr:GH116 family glycosyl hydrolase [Candidatus Aminicenantes bacterium]
MKEKKLLSFLTLFLFGWGFIHAQEGLVQEFEIKTHAMTLERLARPGTPFDKVGRKFAVLGDESGTFEAWAYPLKILRNFEISFFIGSSTRAVKAGDIVRYVTVSPEVTILTFTYQSFTVKAIYITPVHEAGSIILLKVDTEVPLTIVCGFLPVLQPMWPAGIGGQFAYWNEDFKAYFISESTGKNHGFIGSPAASGLSYTPAHMLSDSPSEFQIKLPNPENVKDKFIPIYMAGGQGNREDILKVYKKLQESPEQYYLDNVRHYQTLQESTLQIQTPEPELDLAFHWAKVSFDNLIVENPFLGKGLVAGLGASGTSGRPGFGWFFGGDAYINSFSFMSYGAHENVREILKFTQKWQRDDGKMSHELSQSEGTIDWWNDYHYGYSHGDTTPYYITAMYDYMLKSGDIDFIKESWGSLKKAYNWCLSTDANNDGLMDNKKAGLGALEYGALTGIETDIYLASVWVRAAMAMEQMATAADDKTLGRTAAQHLSLAQKAFEEKFWDKDSQFYVYAFNTDGKHVQEISPWNAVGLMWKLGTPERSRISLERICASELTTDWGIRSISNKSPYFQPLNYNYGAVWPFLTSWVTTALYKHHMPLQGYTLLLATARHTFDNTLGSITEVFSGSLNVWPQEAVSHQGFSTAGVTLPLVRGLLGLEGDALSQSLFFSPQFPADWDNVKIENYKIGNASFSIDYKNSQGKISVIFHSENADGYHIHFAPNLSTTTKIKSFFINGEPASFDTIQSSQTVQIRADSGVNKAPLCLELETFPSLEILPVISRIKVGERNSGLKILSIQKTESSIIIKVEGLSNTAYGLRILNPEMAQSVTGAVIKEGQLKITIPEGPSGEFVPHQITLHIQR